MESKTPKKREYFGKTKSGSKIFGSKKCLVQKIFRLKEVWSKKDFWSTKTLVVEILVKIGAVTAKILLIYTNVARTYVGWTNIILIVRIC